MGRSLSTDRYTSSDYISEYEDWHEADSPWKTQQIKRIIDRSGLQFRSVCDVGCGAGAIVGSLSESYPDVTFAGYEFSPVAFARTIDKRGDNLRYVNGTPFGGTTVYDLGMAIDVFEHVEDYLGFLRSMRKISRYQLYHIPLDLSAQGVLLGRSLMLARSKAGHIHYFDKDLALAALRETGHTVRDWFYTARSLELPKTSLRTKIAAMPRAVGFRWAPDWTARALGGFSILALCE